MKKFLTLLLVLLICLSAAGMVFPGPGDRISVMVIGEAVLFDQPPIVVDGRTLVPLRAVLEKVGATVGWDDQTKTITVTKSDTELTLIIDSQTMQVSGEPDVLLDVPPQVYNGRTLLPIRAVAEKLGYDVEWNVETRTVVIEETGTVMVPGHANTQITGVRNWAGVSSVQQFRYMDEGLAYAIVRDNRLLITTPGETFSIEMKYPKLGDVVSDEDGNFYVVWGRDNNTSNNTTETVFISKYSQEGEHVATTGFRGESRMGANGNTKEPFASGGCVSAFGNGYLMVNYARGMYNGHQSNNVVGVRISDMSPFVWNNVWDVPYVSHSFNQSVIWSGAAREFIYADHGDAYPRGVVINRHGNNRSMLLFHFYLEANANFNMGIVNRTFAQLAGLAETSTGVALVGASAKSIGNAAKTENQNLFVQIFDPRASRVSSSMFTGGEARRGATSTDINDNRNSPLTNVTDYGVIWLTDYTDTDVIAPQVVTADDRLVILWSTANDKCYMVLSASGEVLTPATSLDGLPLNSYEPPIYHDGAIYWAVVRNGRLNIRCIEINVNRLTD